jgi:Ca2+-transporting ATPase
MSAPLKSEVKVPYSGRQHYDLPQDGLSSATAHRRLEEEGYNELPSAKPKSLFHFFLEIFHEPMVFLLMLCGVIYLLLGDQQEALMLMGFLFIIIGITVSQELKAETALSALRDLSSPRALVLRDGERKRIPGRDVVREDLVFFSEGDRIPADGVMLTGSYVAADESLLTGESVPLDKKVGSSLYLGTTVVRGQGAIRITSTGLNTELGKIGKSIQVAPKEPTRLEHQTRKLVRIFTVVAIFLCVLVIVIYGFTRMDWLGGFLAGLSLAMAILPNELPAVLTIFLALGAWRMSQRRVLTRKMSAIENLGSTTVLCVDKTGTLTVNRMSIQQLYADQKFLVLSELTETPLPEEFHEVLEFGILASRQDPFDPMDKAFQLAGSQFLRGTEHLHPDWSLKKEYPISSELLSISHAWNSSKGGEYVVGAKGAPEAIIDLCHLNAKEATLITQAVSEMAKQGLRILAVAKAKMKSARLPEIQHDFDFTFVGLVGLADPIRLEVPQSISDCKSAGIRVIMITGDHPNTARSIAKQIGLQNSEKVLTGSELLRLSNSELQCAIKEVNVFSRVAPNQKLVLVNSLKQEGEIVAMTGDGVNDAPALKNAHIGIAMGGRGSDVARESASLVLLDDDFASIVEAIRMGRRIYSNLQSAFMYLLAAHVPIAGMSVLPVILKLPLVLLPVHIAFLHLIIEPACSVAYEADPAAPITMRQKPRKADESLFNQKVLIRSLVRGGSVLFALLLIYIISLYRGQGELDARALTFTTLIISNLALILTSRKAGEGMNQGSRPSGNRILLGIIIISTLLLISVLYIPFLREMFRFSTLHFIDLGICLGVGILSVVWLELIQKINLRSNRS